MSNGNAELVLVDITEIDDHPQNPRVAMRQDVIDGIANDLTGDYPQEHALLVRPFDGRYQLVSGHHRKRAASIAGLDHVWCWVREMDDDEAFMLLVKSNNQGELDPIEIGIHAFEAVPVAKGGRGKKGGLSEYAEQLGKKRQNVEMYRHAGEVAANLNIDVQVFLGKAQHLAAIHKLPKPCWEECAKHIADKPLSAKDVKERVARAASLSEPELFCADHMSIERMQSHSFCHAKEQVFYERLADLGLSVYSSLVDYHPDLAEAWSERLSKDPDAWDMQSLQERRIEFETIVWERENADESEAELVDVLLADPPWRYDFSETDSRQIENQYPTADADDIATHLDLPWVPGLAEDCVLFMWATAPKLREAFVVLDGWGFEYKTHAVWDKEKIGMGYWFRGQHELLIVATRGNASPPESDKRFSSVFREPRDPKHSKKPTCVYEAIEGMFPSAVKFEMYQRDAREGWTGGGNEA